MLLILSIHWVATILISWLWDKYLITSQNHLLLRRVTLILLLTNNPYIITISVTKLYNLYRNKILFLSIGYSLQVTLKKTYTNVNFHSSSNTMRGVWETMVILQGVLNGGNLSVDGPLPVTPWAMSLECASCTQWMTVWVQYGFSVNNYSEPTAFMIRMCTWNTQNVE